MLSEEEKKELMSNFLFNIECYGEPLKIFPPKTACVYALEMSDKTVKIGVTGNLEERISQIQKVAYLKVKRFYRTEFAPRDFMFQLEQTCRKNLDGYHSHGEYFNISFDDACAELDKHADDIALAIRLAEEKYLDELNFLEEFKKQYSNHQKSKKETESVSDFERGVLLAELAELADDPFDKEKLIKASANLIMGKEIFKI